MMLLLQAGSIVVSGEQFVGVTQSQTSHINIKYCGSSDGGGVANTMLYHTSAGAGEGYRNILLVIMSSLTINNSCASLQHMLFIFTEN